MADTILVLAGRRRGVTAAQAAEREREFRALCGTAGYGVAGTIDQGGRPPRADLYLGRGRVEELARRVSGESLRRVVFDVELTPTQHRNLADALGAEVIDRTGLILNIFAARARSSAGKLQVELARARYLSSRLAGKGKALSRLGGGVGTRGPGEAKIETERRGLRAKVRKAERQIDLLSRRRRLNRERHRRQGCLEITLAGYTNAGKSSLLNALCGSRQVFEADQLFSTLDPTTRRVHLGGGRFVLATDTVGFLRDLPHELIEAFHATLEGLVEADLILVVVDGSDPSARERHESVSRVLGDVSAAEVPSLVIVNKCDLLAEAEKARLARAFPGSLFVSARSGEGLAELRGEISRVLFKPRDDSSREVSASAGQGGANG